MIDQKTVDVLYEKLSGIRERLERSHEQMPDVIQQVNECIGTVLRKALSSGLHKQPKDVHWYLTNEFAFLLTGNDRGRLTKGETVYGLNTVFIIPDNDVMLVHHSQLQRNFWVSLCSSHVKLCMGVPIDAVELREMLRDWEDA